MSINNYNAIVYDPFFIFRLKYKPKMILVEIGAEINPTDKIVVLMAFHSFIL
jgi:hypothetical protein